MGRLLVALLGICFLVGVKSARILAIFPTPSISHQLPFRQLTHGLAKRGHDVTVLTTDPAFDKGNAPPNITEIDVHDMSYKLWREHIVAAVSGKSADTPTIIGLASTTMLEVLVQQLKTPEMQKVLYNDTYDLLLLEAWLRPALLFSHFHKVPVIKISSFNGFFRNYEVMGAPTHPMLYPLSIRQRIYNLTFWEKISELYMFYLGYIEFESLEKTENEVLRNNFDPNMPTLSELENNVDLMFLNMYPIWDGNRPVPPNIIYIGGIHQMEPKKLPKDLESYLNSSKNGVIYMSFGTNTNPSNLPPQKIQMMVNAFSQLPYDVLWKWDKDELPGKTSNIRISKWLPQPDLLKHPKIKLFITQAGLQSTDEALVAGVPLLAIPMLGDQWFNAEKYVHLKIGLQLSIETLTHEKFKGAIEELIGNPSYRENVIKLREITNDQPQSPLDRAIWWTEHVLRHGGARHLRPPSANISWAEYLELELILILVAVAVVFIVVLTSIILYLGKYLLKLSLSTKKEKKN